VGLIRWFVGKSDKRLPAFQVDVPSGLWLLDHEGLHPQTDSAAFLDSAAMPLYQNRILEVADSPEQPWICGEWRADGRPRCMECNKEIALPQHHHCCNGHIHVVAGGHCYYRHIQMHLKHDLPVQPPSQLISRLLIKPASTPGPVYSVLRLPWCQTCNYIGPSLTVDHWNGDHRDNRPENLVTLCSNCHGIKTRARQENKPLRLRQRAADYIELPSGLDE
jgi:5-methylcytosine-specific restriction endonuclease McrA